MTDLNNHNHHDPDLIAAHASGEESPQAEALLTSCQECRAEYNTQRRVAALLAAAPIVTMADHEREALHQRIWAELARSNVAPIGQRRARPQPAYWLLRIGAVAAALAVLAGLTGVLGRLGAGGGDAFAPTTAATAESMIAAGDDGDLNESSEAGLPADTLAGMLSAQAAPQSRTLPGGDADAVRLEAQMLADEPAEAATDERVAAPPCVDQIEGLTPLRWAESTLDAEPIVIIIVEGDEGPEPLFYKLDGCELVEL